MTRFFLTLLTFTSVLAAQQASAPPAASYEEKSREVVLRADRVGVGSEERRLTLDDAIQIALKNNL